MTRFVLLTGKTNCTSLKKSEGRNPQGTPAGLGCSPTPRALPVCRDHSFTTVLVSFLQELVEGQTSAKQTEILSRVD